MASNSDPLKQVKNIVGGKHRIRHQRDDTISIEGLHQPEKDLDLTSLKRTQNPDFCGIYLDHILSVSGYTKSAWVTDTKPRPPFVAKESKGPQIKGNITLPYVGHTSDAIVSVEEGRGHGTP